MLIETALLLGAGLGSLLAFFATPIAIRVADRFDFYDRPRDYKGHGRPTPYLGGSAVIFAFTVAVAVTALTADPGRTLPLLGGVAALWAIGTVDDRITVSPLLRVVVECALAVMLWALGLGWDLGFGPVVDAGVTVVWIVGIVNAFNLFDNMDGATATMGCVVSGALAVLGVVTGDIWLAGSSAALCGACLGFLPHNLATPSRIFLGDGGSMPIGFVVAALAMVGASGSAPAWQALAMGLLLVGIPALDTGLVIVSRARRGIPLLTGGRDHLTHRTRRRLRNARAVAMALGAAQALLGALAILSRDGGSAALVIMVGVYLVVAATALSLLDGPPGAAQTDIQHGKAAARAGFGGVVPGVPVGVGRRMTARLRAVLLALLGLIVGVSLFRSGFYDSSDWVPAGLVALTVLAALLLARPLQLTPPAWAALLGLCALGGWAMLSSLWGHSVGDALLEGNRIVLYAAMLGVLLVTVRDRVGLTMALGGVAGGLLVVALWIEGRMLLGDVQGVLMRGRLDWPLGYINAEGGAFLLGVFPMLALAERHARAVVRGLAASGATLLAGLVFMSQSRGVTLAAVVGVLAVLALLPRRGPRLGLLVIVGAAVLAVSAELTRLYQLGNDLQLTGADGQRGALALLFGCVAAGVAWGLLSTAARRAPAHVARRGRQGLAVATTVAVVAIAGVALVNAGTVRDRVVEQYDAFVDLQAAESPEDSGTRLLSGGGYRYDYWRIAVDAYKTAPLKGIGAGSYDVPYYQFRETIEDVRQPHSLPLQTLAELGLVGVLLLLVVAAACVWGLVRRVRAVRRAPEELGLLVACTGILAVWSVHASVDWIHLVPGVSAAALIAVAGVLRPLDPSGVVAPSRSGQAPAGRRRPPRGRIAAVALLASVTAFGGISLSRQLLAERFHEDAREALAEGRAREAYDAANRSLRLAEERVSAHYTQAAALARMGRGPEAITSLRNAADLEPRNFLTYVLLGDLTLRTGDVAVAAEWYRSAAILNPADEALAKQAEDTAAQAEAQAQAAG